MELDETIHSKYPTHFAREQMLVEANSSIHLSIVPFALSKSRDDVSEFLINKFFKSIISLKMRRTRSITHVHLVQL